MTEENSEIEWNISQYNPRVTNLPCYFNPSLQFHRHVDIDHRIWIIDTRSGWLVYRNWLRMKGMCYCNSCSIDKKAPYDSNSHEFNSSTHAFFFQSLHSLQSCTHVYYQHIHSISYWIPYWTSYSMSKMSEKMMEFKPSWSIITGCTVKNRERIEDLGHGNIWGGIKW